MDSNLTAAIILAIGTILGAIAGAILPNVKALFHRGNYADLSGKWKSEWYREEGGAMKVYRETLRVERQDGPKLRGKITMDDAPEVEWEFEGRLSGECLQLFYYSMASTIMDCGCYFVRSQGNNVYKGRSIGIEAGKPDVICVDEHILTKVTL